MKLSEHLDSTEVACRCGCGFGTHAGDLKQSVIDLFEQARAHFGNLPIVVVSGCRCPTHNEDVGGVRNSAHTEGLALDLLPPGRLGVVAFYAGLDSLVGDGGLGIYGAGTYGADDDFCHIDTARVDPSPDAQAYHKHRRWDDRS